WLFDTPEDVHQAGCRRAATAGGPAFGAVPGLAEAVAHSGPDEFPELVAYLRGPASRRVRTNNHVERADRAFRLLEKVRYRWRGRWQRRAGRRTRVGYLDRLPAARARRVVRDDPGPPARPLAARPLNRHLVALERERPPALRTVNPERHWSAPHRA